VLGKFFETCAQHKRQIILFLISEENHDFSCNTKSSICGVEQFSGRKSDKI
jgi:hypothetical protein